MNPSLVRLPTGLTLPDNALARQLREGMTPVKIAAICEDLRIPAETLARIADGRPVSVVILERLKARLASPAFAAPRR